MFADTEGVGPDKPADTALTAQRLCRPSLQFPTGPRVKTVVLAILTRSHATIRVHGRALVSVAIADRRWTVGRAFRSRLSPVSGDGCRRSGITLESMGQLSSKYDSSFFDAQRGGSLASARAVIKHLVEVVRPASVIDVGCGTGAWLLAWKEVGVHAVVGVDGPWVSERHLLVAKHEFVAADLAAPPDLGRSFDFAMCLEVVEHLPDVVGRYLVNYLTQLSPIVLFSAAIPRQGGVDHVNEQWPQYWNALFQSCGYVPNDSLRCKIWDDEGIDWWYRQNLVLYVQSGHNLDIGQRSLSGAVHPGLWDLRDSEYQVAAASMRLMPRLRRAVGSLIGPTGRRFVRRILTRRSM